MNKKQLVGLGIIVIGLFLLFNSGFIFKNKVTQIEYSDLSGIEHIIIKGSSEDITLKTVKSDGFKAELAGTNKGFGLSKPILRLNRSGDTLEVEVRTTGLSIFSYSDLKLDLELSDKYSKDLSVDLSSGTIELEDTLNLKKVDLHVSSGDLIIEKLNSKETNIDLSSGSITVRAFTGDLSGNTSSGDLQITYLDFDNEIDYDVSSGSVEINLPRDADFELDASKSSGSINIDFELENQKTSDNAISGVAGNGGNTIELNVSSGNISLLKN